jgi:hypothetical protein
MHQPTYLATGESINGQSVIIATPTPLHQLTALLDKIGTPRITFQFGIRMMDTRQHIAYIIKNQFGYTACIEIEKDKVMRPLAQLPVQDITSVIQRVRVDYREVVKGK